MHCLLLGNGINRLSLQLDWSKLLEHLAIDLGVGGRVQRFDDKPLSLLFEELCAQSGGVFRETERSVKKKIAHLLRDVTPHPLHAAFAQPFNVVLTTNYDYTLETAVGGPFFERVPMAPETRYSLFRRVRVGTKEVWHIHGDVNVPETILLGYDHYAGYLQKIRNYLTAGLKPGSDGDPVRSPLKSGVQDFERWQWKHSWVDHFLRDHMHIVGLGLDFTEIDLWWLLLHKRRRHAQTGQTFYYTIKIHGLESPRDAPRLSVLLSLGMTVVSVEAASYAEGYQRVLERVAHSISEHPHLNSDVDESPK